MVRCSHSGTTKRSGLCARIYAAFLRKAILQFQVAIFITKRILRREGGALNISFRLNLQQFNHRTFNPCVKALQLRFAQKLSLQMKNVSSNFASVKLDESPTQVFLIDTISDERYHRLQTIQRFLRRCTCVLIFYLSLCNFNRLVNTSPDDESGI